MQVYVVIISKDTKFSPMWKRWETREFKLFLTLLFRFCKKKKIKKKNYN